MNDSDYEIQDPPDCPYCGGPGMLLGVLGTVTWFRCRNCGIDFRASETVQPSADDRLWPPEED